MKKVTSSKRTDPVQKGLRKSNDENDTPEICTPDIISLSEQMNLLLRSMGNFQDQFSAQTNILNKLMSQNEQFNNELTFVRNQQIDNSNNMKAMEERITQMQLEFDQKLDDRIAALKVTPMEEDTSTHSDTPKKQGSAVSKYATMPSPNGNKDDDNSTAPIWVDKTKKKSSKNKNNENNNNEKNTNQEQTTDKKLTKQQCLRYFSHVSSNQGYQFLYLPIKGKSKLKDMRSNLRQIGLSSGSVIDIQYPTSTVVSLLLHNDYIPTASSILEEEGLIILKDFDPLDIKNLRDPRYSTLTDDEKLLKLQEIRASRFQQTLDFLRPPVKLAVARDFARKGWITNSKLNEILTSSSPITDTTNTGSSTASATFVTKDSLDDVNMDTNETSSIHSLNDDDIELTESNYLVGEGEPTLSS